MSAKENWPEPVSPKSYDGDLPNGSIRNIAEFRNIEDAKRVVELWNATLEMSDPAKEIQSMREKAEMFRYLCKLQEIQQADELKGCPFCIQGAGGQVHWGKTYAEAVRNAMNHDKGVTP